MEIRLLNSLVLMLILSAVACSSKETSTSTPLEAGPKGEKQQAAASTKQSKKRVKPAVRKPSVDILGLWKQVTSGSASDSISILYRKDRFQSFQGMQRAEVRYTIVSEKPGEMELSWKSTAAGKEIRAFVRRKGDRLWKRFSNGQQIELKFVHSVEEDDRQLAETQLQGLRNNLGTFRSLRGRYPKELQKLRTSGLTMRPGALIDPWKKPFQYSVSGNEITLCSDGPDGKRATKDDVCLPSAKR
jgi:hypothetical protein